MNRNKRNRYKSLILAIIKQEQLILAQEEDSKKGQMIYLMRRVVFKAKTEQGHKFVQNDQISIRDIKETHEIGQIVKISEIFNRLVFPLNFNRFCHPMTQTLHPIITWIQMEEGTVC